MEQQAKEELEMLESLYPDRFNYLKLELKSFVSQHHDHHHPSSFHSSMVDTQESSSLDQRKKRKKIGGEEDSEYYMAKKMKKKDRVDLLLERAQACVKKIRQFKASLLSDL